MPRFSQKRNTGFRAGFTLVELLVVIAISATIAAVAVAGFPSFSEKVEFENLLLDVALTVREAQVFGLGTREAGGGFGFDVSYGVHFSSRAPDDTTFVFFADTDNDGVYGGDASGEMIRKLSVKSGYRISRLCTDSGCTIQRDSVDITFRRPNPDARVTVDGIPSLVNFSEVSVDFVSPGGSVRSVSVFPTGQIAIN